MASTKQLNLRKEVVPNLRMTLPIDSTGTEIKVGDPVQLSDTTGKVKVFNSATLDANHRYIGISQTHWDPNAPEKVLRANEGASIIPSGIFNATLKSATYKFGDALAYDASADNGQLEAAVAGEQLIAWFYEKYGTTLTSGKVLVDVFKDEVGTLGVVPT